MSRHLPTVWAVAVLILSNSAAGQQLDATISLQTTTEAGGRLRYEYLVENSAESELAINTLILDVADGADIQALEHPDGWVGDYAPDEPSFDLAWLSEGPQFDIPIGGSGTFSFTSPLEPAPIFYYLANLTIAGDEVGGILDFIDGPSILPEGIPGDYNGNGLVEQVDLDLVLVNWGDDGTTPPSGWTNDPPQGIIDQVELDRVLVNWGNTSAGGVAAAVPEPAGLFLAISCLAAILTSRALARRVIVGRR